MADNTQDGPPVPTTNYRALQNVLKAMEDTNAMFGQQRSDASRFKPVIKTEMNEEGTKYDISMDEQEMRILMDTLGNYSQVVGGYQQEIDRITKQQQSINPIINALTTVAGNLAISDKRLPPVVGALGQSSKELNPTFQQLEDRKLAVLGRLGDVTAKEQEVARTALATSREGRLARAQQDRLALDRQLADLKERGLEEKTRSDRAGELIREKQMKNMMDIALSKEGSQERIAASREAAALDREMKAQTFQASQLDKRLAFEGTKLEKMASLKDQKLDPADKAILEGVTTGNGQIEQIAGVIENHPSMLGIENKVPMYNEIKKRGILGEAETFRQDFESYQKALQGTITQTFGEKTRGFTKAGLEYNMGLIPQLSDTKEVAERKLVDLQHSFQLKVESIAKTSPKLDLSAFGVEHYSPGDVRENTETGERQQMQQDGQWKTIVPPHK